jgi:hypothetical protein
MVIPEREKTTDRYSVSGVMAITKCSIPVPAVNEFTPSLRAARND